MTSLADPRPNVPDGTDPADTCVTGGRWSFPYTAAPLGIVHGGGTPIDPVVIR
ncbi:hypothetical protein ACQP1K_15550 [Sphaerimonospora sp. CA-214678]|uniref:hypothetical protein n=1 Tax=Sphaerimonospora sp. CA-214678 TaxID=3240029 RepID=UPI003D8CA218